MTVVRDGDELRTLLGEPSALVRAKVSDRLNELTRTFVDRSPFVLLATSAADGTCDVSPRGDPPGFVRVLDDRTLLLPDRPGNRLADSLRNILANPHVGLLFIIPGIGDTLRVNGRATVVTDPALLESSTVEGKTPREPETFADRSELPSSGELHRSLNPEFDAEGYDAQRADRYARREGFY